MDEFGGLLTGDFGFRPQGKSAPMSAARSGSGSVPVSRPNDTVADSLFDGADLFASRPATGSASATDFIFDDFKGPTVSSSNAKSASSSMPVFDKPLYDDDMFEGIPGVKSSASHFEDVFSSISSESGRHVPAVSAAQLDDDFINSFSKPKPISERKEKKGNDAAAFEDLIPGFGSSSPPSQTRERMGGNQHKSEVPLDKMNTSVHLDPFVVLETTSTPEYPTTGLFSDPLEQISKPMNSSSVKVDAAASSGLFGDSSLFDEISKSDPLASHFNYKTKDNYPANGVHSPSPLHGSDKKETAQSTSVENVEDILPNVQTKDSYDVFESVAGFSSGTSETTYHKNVLDDQSPRSSEDDVWLGVDEIPLFTQPTAAPPPSRAPPPLPFSKQTLFSSSMRSNDGEYSRQPSQHNSFGRDVQRKSAVFPSEEPESFGTSINQNFAYDHINEDDAKRSSSAAASAAAMKDAMSKAEAKFKHAKEVREREHDAKFAKSRGFDMQDRDEESSDREERERQEILEQERKRKEIEDRRRVELEREMARKAVERANREARERAAIEARERAEREGRIRAERAAVQRAAAEARERAAEEARERAAADAREKAAAAEARARAAVEARERAAAEERQRVAAEKTAAEARTAAERAAVQKANAEARRRAEKAAVEKAAAEARQRLAAEAQRKAAAEAQQKAAAAAATTTATSSREGQQKPEDDIDSFFMMGSRANSAPKQRATTFETQFESQAQPRGSTSGAPKASASAAAMKKASSTANLVDDLASIFGGVSSSSDDFQEIEGESEERRRARLERHKRTIERTEKALAEKNARDMQVQQEQAERHRIAESMDFEIKRWAAGKEGNLRALLSTLQYILWPECGWKPVSLTDLILAASVKKEYRKATLCVHPDKVQQKGATLQQKYIAEKVFDLLKEAWNKFNSEELF